MAERYMEGVGWLSTDRETIPGTTPKDAGLVRYVRFPSDKKALTSYKALMNAVEPCITSGGASLMNYTVAPPGDLAFRPIKYRGDVLGWIRQIEEGAKQCGFLFAEIRDGQFCISDGRVYNLSDCAARFAPELGRR